MFLLHTNFEDMFLKVSPEQCQRLVGAVFRLADDGEDTDFSDDVMLSIFWKQISHFIICNEQKYSDKIKKMSDRKKKYWKDKKVKEAKANNEQQEMPKPVPTSDYEELPF